MFGNIETKPNYPEMEHRLLKFWDERRIFDHVANGKRVVQEAVNKTGVGAVLQQAPD